MDVRTQHLVRSVLHALALAQLVMYGVVPSYAGNLTVCIDRKVTFDGIVRLHYATVKISPDSKRLYIHPHYPERCTSGNQTSCPARAYLIPGNAVAIGKECGGWDYIQYIGEKLISQGWVESSALTPIPPPAPPQPPLFKIGKEVIPPDPPQRYSFYLNKGKGIPVCEAYLQRLNQTEFYTPPYCGRPESKLVPGFAPLHRHYLTLAEFKSTWVEAEEVLNNVSEQDLYGPRRNSDGSITRVLAYPIYRGYTPGAWTYDPPVNFDNSKNKGEHNVVMWTVEDRYDFRCGTPGNPDGSLTRGSVAGLVVSGAGLQIDRQQTYAAFAVRPPKSYDRNNFTEFADELGVFAYAGRVYFDTFLLTGRDAYYGNPGLYTLGVFLYSHNQRREVCEYHVPGLRNSP